MNFWLALWSHISRNAFQLRVHGTGIRLYALMTTTNFYQHQSELETYALHGKTLLVYDSFLRFMNFPFSFHFITQTNPYN